MPMVYLQKKEARPGECMHTRMLAGMCVMDICRCFILHHVAYSPSQPDESGVDVEHFLKCLLAILDSMLRVICLELYSIFIGLFNVRFPPYAVFTINE